MSHRLYRRVGLTALGVAMAGALVAGPAAAAGSVNSMEEYFYYAAQTDFPGGDDEYFENGGQEYIASGGDILLSLDSNPDGVEVLLEKCDSGSDLSDVVNIPEGDSEPRVLAADQDVEAGTCFVVLPRSTGDEPTEIEGTLSF